MSSRDMIVLKKIIQYANEIETIIIRFELTWETFEIDFVVRHAIAMCILQIGELIGKLSDELKRKTTLCHGEILKQREILLRITTGKLILIFCGKLQLEIFQH